MPSNPMDMRLRRYTPGGAAGPVFPVQSIDWTAPMGDVATLNFKVSEAVAGTLPDLTEFAVELFDGTTWKEPRSGRFMNQTASADDLDRTGMKDVTTVSFVHWMLAKAEFQVGSAGDKEFNTTAGGILRTMIDAAKARGWGKFINVTFNAVTDSAGKKWNDTARVEMSFNDGTAISSALQTLADQGVLEYATEGRTLHVYNPGTGSDLSGGAERRTVGGKVKEMPVKVTNEDLLTDVTVRGDDKTWTFPVPGGVGSLGRLEGSVQASGVTKQSQAARFAEQLQATGKAPRAQYTITEDAGVMDARPFIDYDLGDWVSARRPGGWERMRVTELQMHRGTDAVLSADISLADRLTDLAARLAKRNAALGAKLGGNGSINGINDMSDVGGGGDGGAGGPNPMPEYGSGWESAGPGFEWGSEGSDPGTSPEYAENGFTVSELQKIPVYSELIQNEGNIIFNVSAFSQTFTPQNLTSEEMAERQRLVDEAEKQYEEDLKAWEEKQKEREEAEQLEREEAEANGEDYTAPDPADKDEGKPVLKTAREIPSLDMGKIPLAVGYVWGGTVYDLAERAQLPFTDELIYDLIATSDTARRKPPAVLYTDSDNISWKATHFLSRVTVNTGGYPFSSAGWIYIPVKIGLTWKATNASRQVVGQKTAAGIRFIRVQIKDHRTLGDPEIVEKAEMTDVSEDTGNISSTRAGEQIMFEYIKPDLTVGLCSATFSSNGDMKEERFTEIPPHPWFNDNVQFTAHDLCIAKSLDNSGMAAFNRRGDELMLAEDNIRRREATTNWSRGYASDDHPWGTPAPVTVAGRVVYAEVISDREADPYVRLGLLGEGGKVSWDSEVPEGLSVTDVDLYFSYGGYVYGNGWSFKLTPA